MRVQAAIMAPAKYHPLIAKLAERSVARFPCQHRGRPPDCVCVQADAASRAAKPRKRAAVSFMITQTISARSRCGLTRATTVSAAFPYMPSSVFSVLTTRPCARDLPWRLNSSATPATAVCRRRGAYRPGGPKGQVTVCSPAFVWGGGGTGRGGRSAGPRRHRAATASTLPGVVSEAVVSSWGQRLRVGRRSCRPGLGLQVSYFEGTGHLTPGWKGDSRLFAWLGLRTRGGQATASARVAYRHQPVRPARGWGAEPLATGAPRGGMRISLEPIRAIDCEQVKRALQ